jgi:hypothetical protein
VAPPNFFDDSLNQHKQKTLKTRRNVPTIGDCLLVNPAVDFNCPGGCIYCTVSLKVNGKTTKGIKYITDKNENALIQFINNSYKIKGVPAAFLTDSVEIGLRKKAMEKVKILCRGIDTSMYKIVTTKLLLKVIEELHMFKNIIYLSTFTNPFNTKHLEGSAIPSWYQRIMDVWTAHNLYPEAILGGRWIIMHESEIDIVYRTS